MVDHADIVRSAALLIKQHGEQAWTEAVSKYFLMKEHGDEEGMRVWRLIAATIEELTGIKPVQALNDDRPQT